MKKVNFTMLNFPFSGIKLYDNRSREYEFYENIIGYLDNYILDRGLSPSITENGNIAYEVPDNSTSYGLVIGGNNTLNRFILLKQ